MHDREPESGLQGKLPRNDPIRILCFSNKCHFFQRFSNCQLSLTIPLKSSHISISRNFSHLASERKNREQAVLMLSLIMRIQKFNSPASL
jgi:hypothetical protein